MPRYDAGWGRASRRKGKRALGWDIRPSRPTGRRNLADRPADHMRTEPDAPTLCMGLLAVASMCTCEAPANISHARACSICGGLYCGICSRSVRELRIARACDMHPLCLRSRTPSSPCESSTHMPPATEVNLSKAETWRMVYRVRAQMLWSNDYRSWLQVEQSEAPHLWAAVDLMFSAQTSTYRQRMTDVRLREQYDAKADKQKRDMVAVLRRRRNVHDIPFSVAARSLSYFNQRVPVRVWKDQQQQLRITHPSTCKKLLEMMKEMEPEPDWIQHEHVAVFCVDQCNHWQAAKDSRKGKFRGAERLNAQGMPITIRSDTVLNCIQRKVRKRYVHMNALSHPRCDVSASCVLADSFHHGPALVGRHCTDRTARSIHRRLS